jgi:hypothetical protein
MFAAEFIFKYLSNNSKECFGFCVVQYIFSGGKDPQRVNVDLLLQGGGKGGGGGGTSQFSCQGHNVNQFCRDLIEINVKGLSQKKNNSEKKSILFQYCLIHIFGTNCRFQRSKFDIRNMIA